MSPKKSGSLQPQPDNALLAKHGIDPAEPIEALQKLTSTWGENPELEIWAIGQCAASMPAEAGSALYGLRDAPAAKKVRRELKRALYQLGQQGHWQTPQTPPPSTRELLGPDLETCSGWLSPIDPTGTRLLWMARKTASGLISASAVISEDQGLREFHSAITTRKALREAHRDIAKRSGVQLVPTPWEWTHHLLQDAASQAEKGRFPDLAATLSSLVPTPPADRPAPPIDGLLVREQVAADETALADSATLLAEGEVGGWLLPLPWLEETLATLSETQDSVVMVSPAAREERLQEMMQEAVSNLLDPPERRSRFAQRLEESAFLLASRKAEDAARQALAAAMAAQEGKPITQIPVLAEITRRSLTLALQAQASKQAETQADPGSLVVTPQQARAEQARRQGRR